MATRRLSIMLATLGGGSGARSIRNDQPMGRGPVSEQQNPNSNQIRAAKVVAVGSIVTMVQDKGQVVRVSQATDEPFRAGQAVWVTQAKDGQLVALGSRR